MSIKPIEYKNVKDYINATVLICYEERIEVKRLIGVTDTGTCVFDDWTEVTKHQLMASTSINSNYYARLYSYPDVCSFKL